jgi:peptidoglycan-associated lipoprotein
MRLLKLAVLLSAALLALSCAKKQTVEQKEPPAQVQPVVQAPEQPAPEQEAKMEFKTVYFDFDSYQLDEESRKNLSDAAAILRGKTGVVIRLEGHCDERGTIEYNLALGERRAVAVREYLANLGVAGTSLKVVSYGEEKPADPGHDETSWIKNRRVEFIIEKQ